MDDINTKQATKKLMAFSIPIIFAILLQSLYGAVDLLVVGQFAETADVSGVATGSSILQMITMFISGLSVGVTVFVGYNYGQKDTNAVSKMIGNGVLIFLILSAFLTLLLVGGAEILARITDVPEEAFSNTVEYIRICGIGSLFITAYNLLGGIFRGFGDSKTPLIGCLYFRCRWALWVRQSPPAFLRL